ncbi:MAG: carotenoid oxygenase family protein [Pseudomonadales bacterium]
MSEAQVQQPFWLTGNFAPTYEEVTETDLQVTGTIPPELKGRYVRNGANPETGQSPHWFLGNGMLHAVELNGGRATWYRNRYVRTPQLSSFASDKPVDDRARSLANTHVISHAGRILALEEGHWPWEVTPELETVGAYNYGGKLQTGMTAHPKLCPETGELLFFAYGMMPPFMTYHRANAAGELVQSEVIEVKGATMVHDFNVTRNHVIFMDLPLVWNFAGMASGLPIQWSDEYGARLGVMPRNGTNADVTWYDIDPCYVYHPLNAYEEGDDIVIDVCRMAHSMKPGAKEVPPMLWRWTIHTKEGRVSEAQLDERAVEFPRVPDSRVGLRHRYGYMAEFGRSASGGALPAAVAFRKYDLQTGASTAHDLGKGRFGGEPVFVPAAGASNEDDGYLMSFVFDEATRRSELVIADASNMTAPPVARVHLPVRVPAGFHGSWVGDGN